jgi:hypothetical protein
MSDSRDQRMLEPVRVVSERKVWTLNVAAIVERTVGVTRRWVPGLRCQANSECLRAGC